MGQIAVKGAFGRNPSPVSLPSAQRTPRAILLTAGRTRRRPRLPGDGNGVGIATAIDRSDRVWLLRNHASEYGVRMLPRHRRSRLAAFERPVLCFGRPREGLLRQSRAKLSGKHAGVLQWHGQTQFRAAAACRATGKHDQGRHQGDDDLAGGRPTPVFANSLHRIFFIRPQTVWEGRLNRLFVPKNGREGECAPRDRPSAIGRARSSRHTR